MKLNMRRPLAELLKQYNACQGGAAWAKQFRSASAAWEACVNPEWMLWALDKIGYSDQSNLRLCACEFVRETPLTDGRKVWDLLTDERSRNAIEVAERFAAGKAGEDELAAAWTAAWAWAAWAAARTAGAAAWAAARAAQCKIIRRIIGNPFRPKKRVKVNPKGGNP